MRRPRGIPGDFLTQAGPLGDIIPIPIPFIRNVASIGDVFLASGLAFFLFAITVRHPTETDEASAAAVRRRLGELITKVPETVVVPEVRVAAGGALVVEDDLRMRSSGSSGSRSWPARRQPRPQPGAS